MQISYHSKILSFFIKIDLKKSIQKKFFGEKIVSQSTVIPED